MSLIKGFSWELSIIDWNSSKIKQKAPGGFLSSRNQEEESNVINYLAALDPSLIRIKGSPGPGIFIEPPTL